MKGKNLAIAGATGIAVYYFFPQVREILVGGEYSGAGAGGSAENVSSKKEVSGESVGSLTQSQADFIVNNADTSFGSTSINTYDFGSGRTATIIDTSIENRQNLMKKEVFAEFGNTNTFIAFRDNAGNIVGGSDFKNMQSVTPARASASVGSKENVANFVSGQTAQPVIRSSSSSNLNYTPAPTSSNAITNLLNQNKKQEKLYTPAPAPVSSSSSGNILTNLFRRS